jgi:photosystem II stability/assembly factor-like uncharacterized protein
MKKITLILALVAYFATTLSAQWQPTTGIYGGDVFCSVASNANIFIGTRQGIYLSVNNGASWTFASNGLPTVEVFSLATDGNNIYAGTRNKGLFLSTNNGQSWAAINAGINDSTINTIAVGAGKLFVGTYSGIYVSTNNGINWTRITAVPSGIIKSIITDGSNVFAANANGLYKSTDNGNTWNFKQVLPTANGYVYFLASSGNKIVAGTGDGVFLSKDKGQTWASMGLNQPVSCLAIRDSSVFVGTFEAFNVTSDDGVSWRTPSDGLTSRSLYSITLIGANIMLGTSGAAFFMPINGNAWTQSKEGITDTNVSSFAASGGDIFVTTNYGEVYASMSNTNVWTRKTNFMSRYPNLNTVTSMPPFLFVASYIDCFGSSDNGNNWTSINGISRVTSLINKNGVLFAGTELGLFKSTDNGSSWTKIIALGSSSILRLRIINDKIYAIAYNSSPLTATIHISSDNGASWNSVSSNLNTLCRSVTAINSNILIATEQGVLVSRNNSSNWTNVSSGLTNLSVSDLAANGNNIYAATLGGGIFLSNNLGDNWKAVNEGLTTKTVHRLTVADNYLYAATDRGVFRRPLSELVVETKDTQSKKEATLSPNPVSNQLTINVSNALIGENFTVTNVLGKTMQSGVLKDKSTILSVNYLPNGIYFLHFIGTSKTIKFIKE